MSPKSFVLLVQLKVDTGVSLGCGYRSEPRVCIVYSLVLQLCHSAVLCTMVLQGKKLVTHSC